MTALSRKPSGRRFVVAICSIGLGSMVALAVSCFDRGSAEPVATPVTTVEVAPKLSADEQVFSANIQPNSVVELDFQVAGKVEDIDRVRDAGGAMRALQSGDSVSRGQVLARLDASTYRDQAEEARQELAGAQASFTKSARDLERNEKLAAKDFLSQSDLDASRASYESSRAQVLQSQAALQLAQTQVGYASLTSPIDGVVLARNVEIGDLVGVGTTAFQVADESVMKAVFAVPAALALRIETGQHVTLHCKDLPDEPLVGEITEIDAEADQKTRNFDVEVSLANPYRELRAGMVATVDVPANSSDFARILVPLASVVRPPDDPKGYAVYVVEADADETVASLRKVELGKVVGNRIAVASGVDAGDQVIVRGSTIVRDREPVRVIP